MVNRRWLIGGGAAALGAAAVVGGVWMSGSGGDVVPGRARARRISTDVKLPETVDVAIVGGGVIGAFTAYYLARQGVTVALFEKGAIGGEASGRAQGQVSSAGLDPVKLPLINHAKTLWAGINAEIGGETGYRRNGLTYGIRDPREAEYWEGWVETAKGLAPHARLLSAREAGALLPGAKPWLGAFNDSSDGGVEPTLAAPAIAEAARRAGAHIVAPCAVRGFETEAGAVSHVVTERGSVRAKAIVLAGGAWSTLFADSIGLKLPSLNVFSTVMRVDGVKNGPEGNFEVWGAGARHQLDGSYTLGVSKGRIAVTPEMLGQLWDFRSVLLSPPWDVQPHLGPYFFEQICQKRRWRLDEVTPFEQRRILQPSVNSAVVKQVRKRIRQEFPAFAQMNVIETWTGAINATPDNKPVISAVRDRPGLFLATGFSYGMTMGPAVGQSMADLVLNKTPSLDLSPYRYERFIDGSKLAFTA